MAAAHVPIGDLLGMQAPASEAQILRAVEGRLPTSVIRRLSDLGFERTEIDAAVIPSRTLQHRRSRRERLSLEESDRVLRVLRVMAAAAELYGSCGRALEWLRRPNPRLEDRTPVSLLKTDTGSRMVEELLLQIDEGMYV
jgi:putative toxin-antitoxin system antitoxin component (TIGR02293 family)